MFKCLFIAGNIYLAVIL